MPPRGSWSTKFRLWGPLLPGSRLPFTPALQPTTGLGLQDVSWSSHGVLALGGTLTSGELPLIPPRPIVGELLTTNP